MSPTARTPEEVIEEATYHLEFITGYLDDPVTQATTDAIAMRLSAALEALSVLPEEIRDRVAAGEWSQMWGMRNRLAHGYALADGSQLRTSARQDVPSLLARLEAERRRVG